MSTRPSRLSIRTGSLILFVMLSWGAAPAVAEPLNVELWPGGVVHYRFFVNPPFVFLPGSDLPVICTPPKYNEISRKVGCLELEEGEKIRVRDMGEAWNAALHLPDPLSGREKRYIEFVECGRVGLPACPESHVLVRYNRLGEVNNMCSYFEGDEEKVGRNPTGVTDFNLLGNQPKGVVLHEMGHCLGLWHEQNRADRDRWLRLHPTPVWCADPKNEGSCTEDDYRVPENRPKDLLPLLGNFDYDSVMLYGSYLKTRRTLPDGTVEVVTEAWLTDRVYDTTWLGGTSVRKPLRPSRRDISRVLQYYAHERNSGWGFFQSLSRTPQDPIALPNPLLSHGVRAVGTPAIAHQSPGNFDLFARGSDGRIYSQMYRHPEGGVPVMVRWRSIGCCFDSDPSAVSRSLERIDVVAVNTDGDVQRLKYIDGVWSDPLTLRGGHPTDGIKQGPDGRYIGPAIAARGASLLDVFVVRQDGRLAVSTWSQGNWGAWRTLGQGYDVTARPAALALSVTEVRLAINASDDELYEPLVTFPGPSFSLGDMTATVATRTPPALAARDHPRNPYRVLITNAQGRISHRTVAGSWRDIGGIPKTGTGPSAVATGGFAFMAVMNGEDATVCTGLSCDPEVVISGQVIQAGGLWIRHFD